MSAADRRLGFSWPVLVGLAALAAPRIVLHDLGVTEDGSLVAGLLVFVPMACWIAAVLWKRPAHPFLAVVVIGLIYGVFLALGHLLLWDATFPGGTPALTGVDPGEQVGVLRTATAVSSVVTGTLVGAVTGVVALLLCRLVPAPRAGDDASDHSASGDGSRT